MIRTLALIAAVGFFVSVVCLSTAAAIGGRDLAEHGWRMPVDWHVDIDDHDDGDHERGPTSTRQLAWSGGDSLSIDAPASVRYTQGPGPAKIEVTGPADLVDDVHVDNGRIDVDGGSERARRLLIVITAPNITHFDLENRSRLNVQNYDQDRLEISMSGRSSANVEGKARDVVLSMSGRGDADLGQLTAADARVAISGSGQATLAATDSADVGISGDGQVTLLTRTARVRSEISGNGHMTQVAPPPVPTTPPRKS